VRLWDMPSRRQLGSPLSGHPKAVDSVAFSPDGTILASGSKDTSVRLWDVPSRRQLGSPVTGHTTAVDSVAFSLDGTTLATGGDDSVRLWNIPPLGEPASTLCRYVGQSLTRDHWQSLVPDGPKYRPLCPSSLARRGKKCLDCHSSPGRRKEPRLHPFLGPPRRGAPGR
jgi:WD40 repeat protein